MKPNLEALANDLNTIGCELTRIDEVAGNRYAIVFGDGPPVVVDDQDISTNGPLPWYVVDIIRKHLTEATTP